MNSGNAFLALEFYYPILDLFLQPLHSTCTRVCGFGTVAGGEFGLSR